MMKLPFLLAGPMVRRVEATRVCLWLATSSNASILPEIYQVRQLEKNQESYDYLPLSIKAKVKTMQMGEKLFIHLIEITPRSTSFPAETLLAYHLQFINQVEIVNLESLGLLTANHPRSIVYGNHDYPTFSLPSEKQSTILYGSCRKPHGEGEDAFISGNKIMQDYHDHLDKRPTALFLLGDQIYADDVADSIAPFIYTLGKELIGREHGELVKRYGDDAYTEDDRQSIMENKCKFTSRKAKNHLITMGEYAAMYLLVWNPDMWDLFKESLQGDLSELSSFDHRQYEAITQFEESLPHARRLMANIPTYMMFDDHDVTDDWNISAEWHEQVAKSPLGKHVIANALCAYWAFQGWGNNPNEFTDEFLTVMKDFFQNPKLKGQTYKDWLQVLWDFPLWSFTAPTNPTTLFLDTRTKRAFPDNRSSKHLTHFKGPELISKQAWDSLAQQLTQTGWKPKTPLIIVSPVPFYGIEIIEHVLLRYISPLRNLNVPVETLFDMEAWQYNGKGVSEFVTRLMEWNPSHCYILSGDTHIASSAVSEISTPNGEKFILQQLTSSPMKNTSFKGLARPLLKTAVKLHQWSKTELIERHCRHNFLIAQGKVTANTGDRWSEKLRFYALKNDHSLMTMDNNIGLVKIRQKDFVNGLLIREDEKSVLHLYEG
jgi:hypothetical protein